MKARLIISWFILITILIFGSCKTSKISPIDPIKPSNSIPLNRTLNSYEITVELDTVKNELKGTLNTIYVNNENIALEEIYFHLYPNAYKTEDTTPISSDDFNLAYKNGFKPGYINISRVTTNGEEITYNIEGIDSTILHTKLKTPIKPLESINISMNFSIILPPAGDRLGYDEGFYNFGNWYPIAAVYDETGWNLNPYYPIGDPFYSDVADYKVTITVPKDMIVASSGEIISENSLGDNKTYYMEQKSVRDFAFVTSSKLKFISDKLGDTEIKSYYPETDKERGNYALETAKTALKLYNKTFGTYPYNSLSIVATSFSTGMEYPSIVFINKDFYHSSSDKFYLEATLAHEIAHQWWYGVVGNNQVDEAWLDESLASYSEVLYYENTISKEYGDSYMQNDYTRIYNNSKNDLNPNSLILQSLGDFETNNDYIILVYYRGTIMQDTIRREVGDEAYFKILSTCFKRFKYKNISTKDFISIVEEITNRNWDTFFNSWLKNK